MIFPIRVCVALTCLAGLLLAGGCGESAQQAQGRRLREDASRAHRRCQRAIAILDNPYYKTKDGEAAPFVGDKIRSAADVVIPVAGEMNPKALEAIREAVKELGESLQTNAQAAPADKAFAQSVLARALTLRGGWEAAVSVAEQDKACQARLQAESLLDAIRAKTLQYEQYQQIVASSGTAAGEIHDAAAAKVQELTTKLSEADKKLQDLQGELKTKTDANLKLEADAAELRSRSATAEGEEGLKIRDQAREKQLAADEAAAEAARLESEISLRQLERKEIELNLVAEKSVMDETADLQAKQTAGLDALKATQKRILDEMTEAQKAVEELLQTAGAACGKAAAAEKEAAEAYRQAGENLVQAANQVRAEASNPNAISGQADLKMTQAGLYVRRAIFRAGNQAFLQKLETIWQAAPTKQPAPQAVEGIKAYGQDEAKDKELMVGFYTEATQLYGKAVSAVRDQKVRWEYQGALGAAYRALYVLTGNATYRDEAAKVLSEALQDKAASPYLSDVKRLQDLLARG